MAFKTVITKPRSCDNSQTSHLTFQLWSFKFISFVGYIAVLGYQYNGII